MSLSPFGRRPAPPPHATPSPIAGGPRGIERVIVQIERKTMPESGRVVEVRKEVLTQQQEWGFGTQDVLLPAVGDCGCSVASVGELIECSSCQGVVCRVHGATCGGCGRVVCLVCSKPAESGRLCGKCAGKEKRKRLMRSFVGFFWKSQDE